MKVGSLVMHALLATTLVAPQLAVGEILGFAGNAPGPEERCAALLDAIRKIAMVTRETIAQLDEYRRKAEEQAEWFGHEGFEPYITVLRRQQQKLQADLQAIETMRCPGQESPVR